MIAVNKTNGYIFTVVAGADMMRSTDNGASWVLKNSGLTSTSVQAMVINADGVIFAGTSGQGVFRSIDHGESWTQINTGIATTHRNIRTLASIQSPAIFLPAPRLPASTVLVTMAIPGRHCQPV